MRVWNIYRLSIVNCLHAVNNLSQLMRLWYLSHRRPAKAQASLRIRAVSPEPSLLGHMNYGSRRRVRPNIRHLAPLDGCACVFQEWILIIVVNSSRSRTRLSHFSRRIWEIHAQYTCFLRLQLLAKIGYIPQFKGKNPRGLYEISFPLTRMDFNTEDKKCQLVELASTGFQ